MRDLDKEFKTVSKKVYKLKVELFTKLLGDAEKIKNLKKVQDEFQLLSGLTYLLDVIETGEVK